MYLVLIHGFKKIEKELKISKKELKEIIKKYKNEFDWKIKLILDLKIIGKIIFKIFIFFRSKVVKIF